MILKNLLGVEHGAVDDLADGVVNFFRRFLAVLPILSHLLPEKYVVAVVLIGDVADLRAHAPFEDHLPGQLGGPAQIVLGSVRNRVDLEFLRRSPSHHDGQPSHQILPGVHLFFLQGQLLSGTKSLPPGDNGHLVDGIGGVGEVSHQRVTGLVDRHGFTLILGNGHLVPAQPHQDLVAGFLHHVLGDDFPILLGGEESRFVQEVFQIGAGEPRGSAGQFLQIHVLRQGFVLRVDLKNFVPFGKRRHVKGNLAVEPAGAHEGLIQNVRSVGRRQQNDAGVRFEPVHFVEQLIQGLFPFVVTASDPGTPFPTNGINLVDEDDGRGDFLGPFEQIPDPAGPDADEHFHEVGPGGRQEGNFRLTGDGACHEGFSGAGWTGHEDPFRDFPSDPVEFFGRLQELDDLGHLVLGPLVSGDVVEGNRGFLLVVQLRLAFPDPHHAPAHGGPCAPDKVDPHPNDYQEGEPPDQKGTPDPFLVFPGRDRDPLVLKHVEDAGFASLGGGGHKLVEFLPLGPFHGDTIFPSYFLHVVPSDDGDGIDLIVVQGLDKFIIIEFPGLLRVRHELVGEQRNRHEKHHEEDAFGRVGHGRFTRVRG